MTGVQTCALPIFINAANEVAIERFINKEIGFMDISKTILDAYEKFDELPKNVDDVFAIDEKVRREIRGV